MAGIELIDGEPEGWIRPISDRERGSLKPQERRYARSSLPTEPESLEDLSLWFEELDGVHSSKGKHKDTEPMLLDIMEVPLLEHNPAFYQQENWLIDSTVSWKFSGKYDWYNLNELAYRDGHLWLFDDENSVNDRITESQANRENDSLRIIHVENLVLEVTRRLKKKVKARFEYHGVDYRLSVTDPTIENKMFSGANSKGRLIDSCYLTVSLGKPYQGHVYKLVAALMEEPE